MAKLEKEAKLRGGKKKKRRFRILFFFLEYEIFFFL
jgi:hypothetical protein